MSRGYDVDTAVQGMLAEVTAHDCHLIRVPPSPDIPYTVLYPIDQPRGGGSWENPEEDRDFPYQVTVVGQDARQVRRVQELVEEGFLSRAGGGDYAYPIVPGNGANVHWRLSDRLGAVVPSGDELFKADDTYRVRVGR